MRNDFDVVTGAFGFSGRSIARQLLDQGRRVRTITGHPTRSNPFEGRIDVRPFAFDRPDGLADTLRGASTLYNTYWIRVPDGRKGLEAAVRNSRVLLDAAKAAGVKRIVQVSLTNASPESPIPYFREKGVVDDLVRASGIPYAIVRPSLIFGRDDVVINKIAWFLRNYPIFLVPGKGDYHVQPVHVEDLAEICIRGGQEKVNVNLDAIGPDRFTFEEMIQTIARHVSSKARIVKTNPEMTLWATRLVGRWVKDVILTRDELDGLLANALASAQPPTGTTRLADWLRQNAREVGMQYAAHWSARTDGTRHAAES